MRSFAALLLLSATFLAVAIPATAANDDVCTPLGVPAHACVTTRTHFRDEPVEACGFVVDPVTGAFACITLGSDPYTHDNCVTVVSTATPIVSPPLPYGACIPS